MGRTGSCLDNAVAESWFTSLKVELVGRYHYRTRAALVAGLPARIRRQRADQLDTVVGAGVQDVVHARVAGIDQVLVGQQVGPGEVGVAVGDGVDIVGGGHGRGDVHDQVGPVGFTGLGEVGLVATPAHPTFDPIAGLGVIRAADCQRAGWQVALARQRSSA
jgi:hypothetical protein